MATIVFRGSRAEVTATAVLLARILSGREPDRHNIGFGFNLALGFSALQDIKDAYEVKADGGTDEMGIKWKPLSKEYVAYQRRFGRGEQARLKRAAGLGRSHRTAPGNKKGLLTPAQLQQWRDIYSGELLFGRFAVAEPGPEEKSRAAAKAWFIMKRRGAKTKLEVFGNRRVQILRDEGRLFNSLSPGIFSGSPNSPFYATPTGDQIMESLPGEVIVGTNVVYASAHQETRPIIPDERHPVPAVWWARWAAFANRILVKSIEVLFREGPR